MNKILILVALLLSEPVAAGICDYRPSAMVEAGAAAVAGGGLLAKASGYYAIQNYTTGAWMLSSTSSGILAGTSGAGILLSPFILVPAAVATVGLGIWEGGCYLTE